MGEFLRLLLSLSQHSVFSIQTVISNFYFSDGLGYLRRFTTHKRPPLLGS